MLDAYVLWWSAVRSVRDVIVAAVHAMILAASILLQRFANAFAMAGIRR